MHYPSQKKKKEKKTICKDIKCQGLVHFIHSFIVYISDASIALHLIYQ